MAAPAKEELYDAYLDAILESLPEHSSSFCAHHSFSGTDVEDRLHGLWRMAVDQPARRWQPGAPSGVEPSAGQTGAGTFFDRRRTATLRAFSMASRLRSST